jgi:hypothetical protein
MKREFTTSTLENTIKCVCGMEFTLFVYMPSLEADNITVTDRFSGSLIKCDFCPFCGQKQVEEV